MPLHCPRNLKNRKENQKEILMKREIELAKQKDSVEKREKEI